MIICLIVISLIALSVAGLITSDKRGLWSKLWDISFFVCVFSALSAICILMVILINNIAQGTEPNIQNLDAKRAYICDMIERVDDGGYEDVSAVEVGNMIVNWNDECYRTHYWLENPWTSWFYSKKAAEHLIPIER